MASIFDITNFKSEDMRIKVLVGEIKLLFENLTKGEILMEEKDTMSFIKKLLINDNYSTARAFVEMYNYIPESIIKIVKNKVQKNAKIMLDKIKLESSSFDSIRWYNIAFSSKSRKEKYKLKIEIQFLEDPYIYIYDLNDYHKDLRGIFPEKEFGFLRKEDGDWFGVYVPLKNYIQNKDPILVKYLVKIFDRIAEFYIK